MDWAIEVAKEFIEEDVPYIIETGKGTKLTNTKMYVSRRVPLTKNGKSVFINDALNALEGFKDAILQT